MATAMSSGGWKRAFSHAKETEAEGAKYFEGYFKEAKVVKVVDVGSHEPYSSSDASTRGQFRPTYTEAIDNDDAERGGFCQPSGLANFFKRKKTSKSGMLTDTSPLLDIVVDSTVVVDDIPNLTAAVDTGIPETEIADRENGMTRQICRAWLKHTYLQLGQACKSANCERRHLIEAKSIGFLYKDYSFKGLATAQRNSIIAQIQAAALCPEIEIKDDISIKDDDSSDIIRNVDGRNVEKRKKTKAHYKNKFKKNDKERRKKK